MIDKVRQTVMYVLNKDNNGYITPDEFNKYADMAQNEIFQEYFDRYNDYKNKMKMGRVNSGYADIVKQMEQAIDYFTSHVQITNANVTPATFAVTVDPVSSSIVNVAITNPGGGYPPSITTGNINFATSTPPSITATATWASDAFGNIVSVIITNAGAGYIPNTIVATAINSAPSTSFSLPSDWFLINSLYWNQREIQAVTQQRLYYLTNSNLTAPSETYPSYVMHGNDISVYPASILGDGAIEIFYIRYPRIPNWTYNTITNSEPIFNQNDPAYQDFEVAETEYVKLALKILQYCGVQIREQEVVTYAAQQEQITHQTEKQ
jgi:hypothetical protein